MSLSKHKSVKKLNNTHKDKNQENNIIQEHIRRIDGTDIFRKYVKCGLLGKGGFANCFITENTETKSKAATKIVLKEELRSHRTRLRLANEIKLHKTLHHPNVVQFYHCFEDRENVYIFLQLCQNQSLSELIRIRGTFLTPEIQSFLYGIVNGIKYIHAQKIIHRDLKLGNIFVDGKLNVKIGDFGLATKLQFHRQCKRTVCGTPNYIAPEVLDGRGYHFQVDIWSIGVILYTLYFGIPPFETEDANSTYQKIKDCDYLIPKTVNTPNEAITLIRSILVKNPAERPTLDDILASDFMKIGNGVLRELPHVCCKKAPTKKDLSSSLPLSTQPELEQLKHRAQSKSQLPKEYLTEFQQVLEDTFFFRLANDICGIYEKDVRTVYMINGKYYLRSLSNNYEEEAGQDCELKYLLMSRVCNFNVLDEIISQKQQKKTLFVRKIQKIKDGAGTQGWLVKLSSKAIHLLIDYHNYLIWGKRVWEVTGGKEKELAISKLKTGTLKGVKEHLNLLSKIALQLEIREDASKESKENSNSSKC